MANNNNSSSSNSDGSSKGQENLLSSIISDIKSYSGNDPLLPWLRGIRKMKETLPSEVVKEKLPRFLQKCAQSLLSHRRYSNDLRYLRIWLQLMDFVDDPGAVLGKMKANGIGMRRALFYQASALYYEKIKKFEEAEKMYHLGVNNLAEPMNELQVSFEQFLCRLEQHKNKRTEGRRTTTRRLRAGTMQLITDEDKEDTANNKCNFTGIPVNKSLETQLKLGIMENKVCTPQSSTNCIPKQESHHPVKYRNKFSDDTVVVKFVDTALVGKSEAEDARHHGLVEPTVNMKEAMNAINDMFREPLEAAHFGRRSQKCQPNADQSLKNGFQVFVDDNLENGVGSSKQTSEKNTLVTQGKGTETHQSHQAPLQIFVDDEENNEMNMGSQNQFINENQRRGLENCDFQDRKARKLAEHAPTSGGIVSSIVCPNPEDMILESSKFQNVEKKLHQARQREDTVVYRFVGSTISDDPQVENVCHHGLVEPTVNLKEAMNDINSMFGKPIEFARKNRSKKQEKAPEKKRECGGFLILPDDDLDNKVGKFQPTSSSRNESDLFEQTFCTKEAMEEINKMFGMPLDF